MLCKLVKVPYKYVDEKNIERTITSLFLVFENGTIERINCNTYERTGKGGTKTTISNLNVLKALASLVSEYGGWNVSPQ